MDGRNQPVIQNGGSHSTEQHAYVSHHFQFPVGGRNVNFNKVQEFTLCNAVIKAIIKKLIEDGNKSKQIPWILI